jgi:hypothetical protein
VNLGGRGVEFGDGAGGMVWVRDGGWVFFGVEPAVRVRVRLANHVKSYLFLTGSIHGVQRRSPIADLNRDHQDTQFSFPPPFTILGIDELNGQGSDLTRRASVPRE